MEFLENRRSWEKQKPPENRQKSGLFWASPFTMHLVCTLLILVFCWLVSLHFLFLKEIPEGQGSLCLGPSRPDPGRNTRDQDGTRTGRDAPTSGLGRGQNAVKLNATLVLNEVSEKRREIWNEVCDNFAEICPEICPEISLLPVLTVRLLETMPGEGTARNGRGRARTGRGPGEERARPGEERARPGECKGVRGRGRKTLVVGGHGSLNRAKWSLLKFAPKWLVLSWQVEESYPQISPDISHQNFKFQIKFHQKTSQCKSAGTATLM